MAICKYIFFIRCYKVYYTPPEFTDGLLLGTLVRYKIYILVCHEISIRGVSSSGHSQEMSPIDCTLLFPRDTKTVSFVRSYLSLAIILQSYPPLGLYSSFSTSLSLSPSLSLLSSLLRLSNLSFSLTSLSPPPSRFPEVNVPPLSSSHFLKNEV